MLYQKKSWSPGGEVAILVKKTYYILDPDLNPPSRHIDNLANFECKGQK